MLAFWTSFLSAAGTFPVAALRAVVNAARETDAEPDETALLIPAFFCGVHDVMKAI